jgi:hypothetical protein
MSKITDLLDNVSKAKTVLEKAQADYDKALEAVRTDDGLKSTLKDLGLVLQKVGADSKKTMKFAKETPTEDDTAKILEFIGSESKKFGDIGKKFNWHHLAVKSFIEKHPSTFKVTPKGVAKK